MADLKLEPYFTPAEELTQYLCEKTQSVNASFFRTLTDYNLCKMASVMRVTIKTHDRGSIPINMYAMALAPSGTGKGHSTNIMEESVMQGFRDRYVQEVLPDIADTNLAKLATLRATKKGCDPDDERKLIDAEFERAGTFVFNFDSATTAAVKQMRHKLLMCGAGAVSMEIDEIGSNLLSNQEVLASFLELFDVGKIKAKLTKNTNENIRGEEIEGKTPTNLMLLGTPSKLLNGGKAEEELMSMYETGYARRCFFSYTTLTHKQSNMTAEEAYLAATNKSSASGMHKLSVSFERLADVTHFGTELVMDKDVALEWIKYRMGCELEANKLSEHEEIRKAEITHRYFKAMKLAGAYAFADGSYQILMKHLLPALKRAEESGQDFCKILTRDRNYVKLAKYIANVGHEVTNVDLVEDLPFYRGAAGQKAELVSLATAWAYKNNIVIKRQFNDGIEFFKGETLAVTDLTKCILSHSADFATDYLPEYAPFDKLGRLFQMPAHNWVNHHLADNYRNDENIIQGFNLVVLDIDGTATIDEAKVFLDEYKYYIYTTKRHGLVDADHNGEDRFRIVLPLSHTLKMTKDEYKQFMLNITSWLPLNSDESTFQGSRKWLTNSGQIFEKMSGDCLNALLFIPKTSKSEQLKAKLADMGNLTNVERWFINNTGDGNRSNQLIKYALMLVDANKSYEEMERAVKQLNEKLSNSLTEAELASTILSTATKAILKRGK
jgi:hypothetical protein